PDIVTVEITEYDSTDWVPVLNNIYFAEGSATIPERYRRLETADTSGFSLAGLTGTTLDVYYDVMNIVGWRMRQLPGAVLQVVGHRNGREAEAALGRRRAEAVRDYLIETWGIDPQRI